MKQDNDKNEQVRTTPEAQADGNLDYTDRKITESNHKSVKAREMGMDTYYHNHTEEFSDIKDGKNAMDIISENGCKLEIDTYWSFCAGIDNSTYLPENKDKIVLVHVKDGVDRKPTALGEGENDLAKVKEGVEAIGLEWIILENDDPVPTGLEDITRSYKWLKNNF